jgi:hypothetical protein
MDLTKATPLTLAALLLAPLAGLNARAGDVEFSNPANDEPAPPWAVGQSDRAPELDALPGFQHPPPGFGVVPFFWWLGDPLTKERLGWILDQMNGLGISGYQINYAHSDGLLSYSGGAWYRKTVTIPAAQQVVLDLGEVVASAEVRVNGQAGGIRVSPPWRFDITKVVKPGANRIEVLVYNTLANHYSTVPTSYRGDLASGLIGPVALQLRASR